MRILAWSLQWSQPGHHEHCQHAGVGELLHRGDRPAVLQHHRIPGMSTQLCAARSREEVVDVCGTGGTHARPAGLQLHHSAWHERAAMSCCRAAGRRS